jgi:hypothetical protein
MTVEGRTVAVGLMLAPCVSHAATEAEANFGVSTMQNGVA